MMHRPASTPRLLRVAALFGACTAGMPFAHAASAASGEPAGRFDPPLARQVLAPAPAAAAIAAPARALPAAYAGERVRVEPAEIHNLFQARNWQPPAPPPPPPAVAPPPPKPTAPKLPFTFMGVIGDGHAPVKQALLARGDALFIAKQHDVIEGVYRVDAVAEEAVEFTYLPLSERQTLMVGGGAQ